MGAEHMQNNNEAWKKKYLRRLNNITVIVIVVFSILHFGGFAIKGVWNVSKNLTSSFLGLFGFQSSGNSRVVDSGISQTDSFNRIEGTLDLGDISIVYGDDYCVEMKNYTEDTIPTAEISNGTLKLKQKQKKKDVFGNNLPNNAMVIITLPEGTEPELDLKLSMGSMDLKNLSMQKVKLDLNMGSISLSDCEMDDVNISADMGAVDLNSCSFDEGSFDANMGGITLRNCSFDSADCDADMGAITVSGSFDELTADCDMGSIDVSNSREDAKYELDADMGRITVNGKDQGGKYKN